MCDYVYVITEKDRDRETLIRKKCLKYTCREFCVFTVFVTFHLSVASAAAVTRLQWNVFAAGSSLGSSRVAKLTLVSSVVYVCVNTVMY